MAKRGNPKYIQSIRGIRLKAFEASYRLDTLLKQLVPLNGTRVQVLRVGFEDEDCVKWICLNDVKYNYVTSTSPTSTECLVW